MNPFSYDPSVNLVDAVCAAFSQICVHLSEPLYDMVLNMVFDFASNNVRTNAVRAIHQLVECVANANPTKTLGKFLPFCSRNIRTELEHGASSVRTTSLNSMPLPSDATLHWSKPLFLLGMTLILIPLQTSPFFAVRCSSEWQYAKADGSIKANDGRFFNQVMARRSVYYYFLQSQADICHRHSNTETSFYPCSSYCIRSVYPSEAFRLLESYCRAHCSH